MDECLFSVAVVVVLVVVVVVVVVVADEGSVLAVKLDALTQLTLSAGFDCFLW